MLSLSIDLHMDSTAPTEERAVAGVTTGLIRDGESVTWRGRHFGVTLQHTGKITRYEPPTFFQDVMTAGMFKSFEHDHHFQEQDGETVMRDELRFSAPLVSFGDHRRKSFASGLSNAVARSNAINASSRRQSRRGGVTTWKRLSWFIGANSDGFAE